MSNEITKKILEDMLDLSVVVIRYAESQKVNRSIQDQLIRAGTSIGANYSEAQDASSKKDFLSKIYIAKKEASETKYWLAIIVKLTGDSNELIAVSEATQRYIMMLQKIVNTSREPNRKSPIANSSEMDNR